MHLADTQHLPCSIYINRFTLLGQIKTGFCQNKIYSALEKSKIKHRINFIITVRILFFPVHTIKKPWQKRKFYLS